MLENEEARVKETSIDATKARREFFRILSEVRYGGRKIVVRRWGRPQAIMIPLRECHRLKRQALFHNDMRNVEAEDESARVGKATARALAREIGIEP